jgi:hypothetical protein
MLGWDRYRFYQKRVGTRYTELVFLNPMGSAGRVVHFDGSRNVDALFFMLWWASCGFRKKRVGTRYTKLVFSHPVGSGGHVVHFSSSEP